MHRPLLLGAIMLAAAAAGAPQGLPARFRIDVTPLTESAAVRAGSETRVALRVSLPEGFHVQSNQPRDPTLIPTVLYVDPPSGVTAVEVAFPPSTDFQQKGSPQPLAVFEREFVIGLRLSIARGHAPGEIVVPGRLRYQACDDTVCFKPVTLDTSWTLRVAPAAEPISKQHAEIFSRIPFGRGQPPPRSPPRPQPAPAPVSTDDVLAMLDRFTVLASTGGYMNVADFQRFIQDAETGTTRRGLFEGRGPLAILAIVFLGGLALNLTPCVLPMIPINLAIIGAGTQAGRRSRGLLLGATYGAAMAVAYGALGLVVILTASTFGSINASPWFNISIAALFVVLGLAMFDVISVDFSRLSSRIRFSEASRGTFLLAFGMGAVAAVLAGACVAPVVIQVIVFAGDLYASGVSIALALPFFLGLGMALPWPIAGAGLAALPKPGVWMVRVKQVLGVFILGTAVYYGYVAYGLFANRWVDPATVEASVKEKLNAGWHASLTGGLAIAQRENRLVLVDVWATWCKNCLVMDKTTLADPAIQSALASYVRIKFQAEDPDASPASEVMQRLDGVGLPTYAILRPKS